VLRRSEQEPTLARNRLLAGLFFASGALALVHQVVWIRKLTLAFGATSPAVSLVLAVFFSGMALGAWSIGRYWRGRPAPVTLYARLEVAIGVWALLFPSLLAAAEHLYLNVYDPLSNSASWLFVIRAMLAGLLLLVPSALMGATLPVVVRHFVTSPQHLGDRVGGLYALNTIGGAVGAFAAGFWSIERLGVDGTIYAAALGNLVIGAIAYALTLIITAPTFDTRSPTSRPQAWNSGTRVLAATAFGMCGFTGIAYEVVWTRYLSLFMTTSVYAYSTMLGTFLVGLAVGSYCVRRWADRHVDPLKLFGYLQVAIGITSFAVFPALVPAADMPIWWMLGDPVVAQVVFSATLMMLPTMLMGAAFPLISRIVTPDVASVSRSIGMLYALNTFGAILGSVVAAFVLIPFAGVQASVGLLATLNIVIGLAALGHNPAGRLERMALASCVAGVVMASVSYVFPGDLLAFRLQRYVGAGERILDVREGRVGTAWVAEDAWGRRSLWGNTSVLGRTRRLYRTDFPAQRFQGHVPLLLHRGDPRQILGIGFGTGQTFGAQLLHPIARLDAVDISPDVVNLATAYFREHPDGMPSDSRARVIIDDGRAFIGSVRERYDVISLEMPPQEEAGIVHFYTREFYEHARARLNPNGVLAQWLPIYNVTPEEARGITRTMRTVFPQTVLWHNGANLLLIGFNGIFELSRTHMAQQVQHKAIARDLAISHLGDPQSVLTDPDNFLAGFLVGPRGLAAYTSGAAIYTDNRPALEFTWRNFTEWGPLRAERLILANVELLHSHLENIAPYIPDASGESIAVVDRMRRRYLNRLEAIALDNLATYAASQGRTADARNLYRRAITLSPDFAQAHTNFASLLQRTGELDNAETEYREALRLEPRFAEAHYGIGTLWEQRGLLPDALKAYHQALNIKKDFRWAQARVARLSRADEIKRPLD
jgi:spermidine synthase